MNQSNEKINQEISTLEITHPQTSELKNQKTFAKIDIMNRFETEAKRKSNQPSGGWNDTEWTSDEKNQNGVDVHRNHIDNDNARNENFQCRNSEANINNKKHDNNDHSTRIDTTHNTNNNPSTIGAKDACKTPHKADTETAHVDAYESFEDMGLEESLLRGIYAFGFEQPSVVQQNTIVPGSRGKDVVIHAQSGTGKSGAFTISLLSRIDFSSKTTQALILSPTRDLAAQTQRVVTALGDYLGVVCHTSIGGRSVRDDRQALLAKPHVVTGTPGRILDNIFKNNLDTRDIKVLVLDEVDKMLDIGFRESVQDIFRELSPTCQVIIASATFTKEVHDIADRFLRNPVKVLIPQENVTLDGIAQFYVMCEAESQKLDVLLDLYDTLTLTQSIVFVNSKRKAEWLADAMNKEDHTVSCIHGEMLQQDRDLTLKEFIGGASRVLIATDVLARGIDVQQVSAVINFEIPPDRADYVHRIGRGGRFGRRAIAINLVTHRDRYALNDIETYWSTEIKEMPNNITEYF